MLSVTFGNLGPESGLLTYITDGSICLNSTFDAHLKFLEQIFSELQASQNYRQQA